MKLLHTMIRVKDIREATMTEEKKKVAKKNIFAFYIGRPISYFFTIPFLYLKIKPNLITTFSMIFSLIGFVFSSYSKIAFFPLIGWFFYFLWNIFDGVDGNVARYKKEFSKNSSLITHSAVSCCDIVDYSVDSPYTTRHHTHHPNRCILLKM